MGSTEGEKFKEKSRRYNYWGSPCCPAKVRQMQNFGLRHCVIMKLYNILQRVFGSIFKNLWLKIL